MVYSLKGVEKLNERRVGPDRVVDTLRQSILEFGIRGSSPTLSRVRTLAR